MKEKIKHRIMSAVRLSEGELEIHDERAYHKLHDVLRMSPGDVFVLCDGKGKESLAEITKFKESSFRVDISKIKDSDKEPDSQVFLFCSVAKRGNFEEAARMAVQAGVKAIVPLVSKRTMKTGLKEERLRRIVLNAAEQSGRGEFPQIGDPMNLKEVFEWRKEIPKLFLHPGEGDHILSTDVDSPVGVLIGPEGGWTEGEVRLAREKGAGFCNLGSLILKTETAAAVSSYILVNKLNN